MSRIPNIKDIKIRREKVYKSLNRPYLCCYSDTLYAAMKNLTHSAFKVYICLISNSNDYVLSYSPQHISDLTGLCVKTCRDGLKELIEKKYVVIVEGKQSLYTFYERPQTQPAATETAINNDPISIAHNALFSTTKPVGGYIPRLIKPREAEPRKPQLLDPDEWINID